MKLLTIRYHPQNDTYTTKNNTNTTIQYNHLYNDKFKLLATWYMRG